MNVVTIAMLAPIPTLLVVGSFAGWLMRRLWP